MVGGESLPLVLAVHLRVPSKLNPKAEITLENALCHLRAPSKLNPKDDITLENALCHFTTPSELNP